MMKKVLAILLALIMVFSLVACGSGDKDTNDNANTNDTNTNDTADTGDDAGTPSDNGGDDADTASGDHGPYEDTTAASGMGFYMPDYDYSQNKTFKVAYMYAAQSLLCQNFSDAFAAWAERMNLEYNDYNSNSDADAFCTTMETYATQGYDGLMLDPDSQVWPRVSELADEIGIAWFPCMSCPTDENGETTAPRVGFDNYQFGVDMMNYCIDWYEENYKDVPVEKVGVISVDWSAGVELHQRYTGAYDTWAEYAGNTDNFFQADGVAQGDFTSASGYDAVSPIISSHPDVEVWLVTAAIDDYALGSAQCLDDNGKADRSCVITCGGTGLQQQWDTGTQTCWRSALYTAQELYAEPIINSLYALMNGWVTHDTLWPDWVNHANGDKYACYILPLYTMDFNTYQNYLECVDSYTGMDNFDYEYDGSVFPLKSEVPASYNA